jgi:hypothetical protein
MSARFLPRSVRVTLALIVLTISGPLAIRAFIMSTVPALITAAAVVFCAIVLAAILLSPEVQARFTRRALAADAKAGYHTVRHALHLDEAAAEARERLVTLDELDRLFEADERPEIDPHHVTPPVRNVDIRRTA